MRRVVPAVRVIESDRRINYSALVSVCEGVGVNGSRNCIFWCPGE